MKFKTKIIKILILIPIVVFITFFLIRFTYSPVSRKFDNLYQTIKKPETREAGFVEYFKYGKRAGDYLINKLPTETDDMLKSDIINVIGHLGCTDCQEKLLPFLSDPDSRVRFFTIDTLDELKYKNISMLLPEIITKDNNKNVKIKAIKTLGKYGSAKDINFLENLAKQEEYKEKNLSKSIDNALSRLKSKGAPPEKQLESGIGKEQHEGSGGLQ